MSIQSYRDLEVWKKSIQLIKSCYLLTDKFPKTETYGISSQLRRSVVSVAANIAEGHSRSSTKEFIRFIDIAYGSLAETETHLIIACELGYITASDIENILVKSAEIGRMLNGLVSSLQKRIASNP